MTRENFHFEFHAAAWTDQPATAPARPDFQYFHFSRLGGIDLLSGGNTLEVSPKWFNL